MLVGTNGGMLVKASRDKCKAHSWKDNNALRACFFKVP